MKNFFPHLVSAVTLLLTQVTATAQIPVPYLVTSACPGSANNPSLLRRVQPSGVPVVVDTVNVAGTNIVVNGLGADNADPLNVYAMSSATGGNALQQPRFYRISLADASATLLGTVAPPPVPVATFPDIGQTFVINQAADGGASSNYYLTGATLIYNLISNTVSNVKLYIGEISLAPVPNPPAPIWRLANTSDPSAAAIISNFEAQGNAYLAGGPLPDGGFQDIAYVPTTGNLISYLGVEKKFVVVSNINTSPVVTVITPSVLLPTSGGSSPQIGALFRDGIGRFFGLRSATARIYRIDPVSGDYLGLTYFTPLSCSLGDGTTAPGEVPLPVTLTRFDAASTAGGVQLTWQTASEANVERFVVERSLDGRSWADGPAVPATNQSQGARYGLVDAVQAAEIRYYRLRIEDRDGARVWSAVQIVAATADNGPVRLLPTWPNPVRANLTIALSAPAPGEAELLNQLGRVVWRGPLVAGRATADVRELSAGVYELVAHFGADQTAHQRIIVGGE
ncbi:MAG: hypothetical protein H7330_13850 [Hymenobacteraceae bacterium]|nr:hypothetical protein [Hymenobacteraceae bacterium]